MKRLIATIIISIIVITPASTVTAASESKSFILGEWQEVPKVVVCEDSPASIDAIKRGMKWWQNRGHRFNVVSLSEDRRAQNICKNVWSSYPSGYIVITKLVKEADIDDDNLAITFVSENKTYGTVRYAKMYLKTDGLVERIIEHELGHALGFRHLKEDGHMMHPIIPDGGWNDRKLIR